MTDILKTIAQLSPEQLKAVTAKLSAQQRHYKQKEFCGKGHRLAETGRRKPNGKPYCQACATLQWADYCKRHPEKTALAKKKYKLKTKYNLTEQDINELLLAQEGKCAICRTTEFGKHGYHIDHDHKTGKIRGILCSKCNCALGQFQDSKQILTAALVYLERTN